MVDRVQGRERRSACRDAGLSDLRGGSDAALRCRGGVVCAIGVRAGKIVLTQGAGGVSLFAVQLAKALGARVIATSSNPENAARLREMGVDEVIDTSNSPDWGDKVRSLTGGRGVDRVAELGGPGPLAQSVKAIAYGGQVSLVGALAGMAGGIDFMTIFLSQ